MFHNSLRLFRRVILTRRLEMSCSLSMGSFQSRPKRAHDDTVEAVVCRENDLEESQMKVCQLGDAGRVLVVKHQGRIYAVGNKCSHYGAPLDRGVFHNGRIRCPWHGACFNVATGDIEDFPGLDGIPSYSVKVADDGAVRVRARKHDVQSSRVCKTMVKRSADNKNTVLVLGGGGAGASCVESLRQTGFTGRVLLATREHHLPYDRPKLSKVLDMTADKLVLRSSQFYQSCDVEVLTNHEASSVDIAKRAVRFTNNAELNYTKLIIATGSRPRRLEVPGADLDGLFTLRSPDDGNKIAARLPDKRVVIVGSGFIGMEAAAYCADKASSVTVVGFGAVPFERALGARIGTMLQALHQSKGVVIRNNLSAKQFRGTHGKLTHVVLSDDSELEADLCLMGVGVLPCTEFLHKSSVSLDQRGYIVVDKHLRSSCPDVYAAGDVASFPLALAGGELVTIGHWQMAHQLGRVAAHNVAGKHAAVDTVPFFWTQMFGKSLRYAGYAAGFDDVVYDGDVESQQFVAYFCRGERVCAVASMGRDPVVAHWAEQMAAHGLPSLQAVQQHIQKGQ